MPQSAPRTGTAAADAPASYEPLLSSPTHVKDELAWELVRDEWELLLAIGSGPTTVAQAARSLEKAPQSIERRVKLLAQHGLISPAVDSEGRDAGASFRLVPAFYERREGMSSYLRDLVLRRVQDGAAPPLAGGARLALGGPTALEGVIARAEAELFPTVVSLASRPESERSERFSLFFAVADSPDAGSVAVQPFDGRGFREQLLRVLKAAATARSLEPDTRAAYLWVAEMRTDPEVAVEIGDLFDRFLESLPSVPTAGSSRSAHGAAAFAVLPAFHRKAES